jgi:signal transduction histidine kinase
VTQALFSMTLTTRSVELLMERDPDAAVRKLGELHELERDALAEMRALIFELRPGSLEQDGLVQALRTHAAAVQGRTGLPVLVEADPLDRLPIELEDALFRIAQEALHNAVKHSSASRVHVRLERSRDGVCLSVEDDGVGFDQTAVPSGHLGVAGMRTRAEQLGARLEVQSRKGAGTRIAVEASAPLSPAESRPAASPGGRPGPHRPNDVGMKGSVAAAVGARRPLWRRAAEPTLCTCPTLMPQPTPRSVSSSWTWTAVCAPASRVS